MINKEVLKSITSKEMDRKEFLKYCGLVLVAAVGLKPILNIFARLNDDNKTTLTDAKQNTGRGFGGGKYGV